MSRREIDANNAANGRLRESRIERIIEDLRLQAEDYSGRPMPLDEAARRAVLEDELRVLESQRSQNDAILDAPTLDQKIVILNNAVMSIYPEITGLKRSLNDWQDQSARTMAARNRAFEFWIRALLVLIALAYGAIVTLMVELYVR